MFVNSKVNLLVRENGQQYLIPAGYIGEIPDWVAETWLVQKALEGGDLVTPEGKKDKDLEAADVKAKTRKKK